MEDGFGAEIANEKDSVCVGKDEAAKVKQNVSIETMGECCTMKDACAMLRKSRPTIYRLMRDGTIQYKKVGGRVYLSRSDVEGLYKF